jgi:hypothetical protein
MPPYADPGLPSYHQHRPIHVKSDYGRASDGCQADDSIAGWRPLEMVAPSLPARIEKRHNITAYRIQRCDTIGFVIVAQGAGQPQILFLGQTAEIFWNEMVHLHERANDRLGRETVPTAMAGLVRHAVA